MSLKTGGKMLLLLIFMSPGAFASPANPTPVNTEQRSASPVSVHEQIWVNGVRVSPEFFRQRRISVPAGRYWYDAKSGIWGYVGGPAVGLLGPGFNFGAPMQPNCSAGQTNVFINGRNIQRQELNYLQFVIQAPIPQGRYSLDSLGWAGPEGGAPRFNLFELIRSKSGGLAGGFVGGEHTGGIFTPKGQAFVCVGSGECASTPN